MASFQKLRDRLIALPVHAVIDAVLGDVMRGCVTVIAASTGSGKSMLLPGALADLSGQQVVVLAPRRFLVMDAAFNVAELAELKIGDEVGYALGHMQGESSQQSGDTKVLYCTYGYAISTGLINKATHIILDEVHEADENISLARAILRARKIADAGLRILEMSATVDPQAQARYWHPIAATAAHKVPVQALACDILHESPMLAGGKDRTIEDIAVDLIKQGRKGIAVFRPGVREVENTVAAIAQLLAGQGLRDVEVCGIHGGTPADLRRSARRAPEAGKRKIIVGTNVIESGVNLRWLDAGISDGYRKIPYRRDDTGADALVLEDLPQSGLLQQIGRINRDPEVSGFARGLFILHAKKPVEARRPQNGPAIQRQNLNGIAFYAACLGYDPTQLVWDVASAPHRAALPARFDQAKQELMRLQLINEDWSLTADGAFISHLPVSPEMGALLAEAKRLDEQRLRGKKPPRVMRDAVIIAALVESHGLRHDTKFGHKGDQQRSSDLLDGMNAFRALRREPVAQQVLAATEEFIANASEAELELLQKQRAELESLCLKHNVSLTGFIEVAHLSDEIANRLSQRDKGIRFDSRDNEDIYDAERYGELQRCILNAHANRVFIFENDGLRDLLRDFAKQRNASGQPFNGYLLGRGSIVPPPKDGMLLVGALREVQVIGKSGEPPLVVLTQATMIPAAIFVNWAVGRAQAHQAVLTDVTLSGAMLNAAYDGKAKFEIVLTPQLRAQAALLGES